MLTQWRARAMIGQMDDAGKIDPEIQARVDALAERLGVPASQVISDALEHGRSLEWQERFTKKVLEGLDAADRGDFACDEDIERVLNKYRQ